ncbi:hypothetical protein [Ancylomarina longa]|uniref:hypothetical protein n=1 Tax=Ancylomarina longa TaxID=2487017 RepID=UPI001ADE4A9D|nr:hypothetical protein [Ancylomarina longa]
MPYRRLPNTDLARVRALKTALDQSKKENRFDMSFSFPFLQKLECFVPHYELAVQNQRLALKQQSEKGRAYNEKMRKARLYVSHFLQVLNFSILRGELKPEVREFYSLKKNSKAIPSLLQEKKLIEWGDKLIKGEQERIRRGGNPIYSPSIALVRVNCENFKQAYSYQKTLQNNTQRFSDKALEYRDKADQLILNIWNEVEAHYSNLPIDERREKCSEYGVIYVWRKEEIEKLKLNQQAKEQELSLNFTPPEESEHQENHQKA